MKKSTVVIIAAVALIVGTAYGAKVPVLGTLAKKLPGAA